MLLAALHASKTAGREAKSPDNAVNNRRTGKETPFAGHGRQQENEKGFNGGQVRSTSYEVLGSEFFVGWYAQSNA